MKASRTIKGNLKLTFESKDEQFPYVAEKNFADSALWGNYDLIHAKLFLDNFPNSSHINFQYHSKRKDCVHNISMQLKAKGSCT